MTTEKPRPEKVAVVAEVRERLSAADAALLTEYRGLKVGDIQQLRRNLREVGGEYKVYKNTLVRFAVRELGLEELEEFLIGPTAIAFVSGDAVNVAKALRDYARTNPALVIKGGVLGDTLLSAADAAALAEVPPREVLLARIAGGLAAPLQQFAGLVQALPRNFAYGLKALIDKQGGVAEGPVADGEEGSSQEPATPPEETPAEVLEDRAPAEGSEEVPAAGQAGEDESAAPADAAEVATDEPVSEPAADEVSEKSGPQEES